MNFEIKWEYVAVAAGLYWWWKNSEIQIPWDKIKDWVPIAAVVAFVLHSQGYIKLPLPDNLPGPDAPAPDNYNKFRQHLSPDIPAETKTELRSLFAGAADALEREATYESPRLNTTADVAGLIDALLHYKDVSRYITTEFATAVGNEINPTDEAQPISQTERSRVVSVLREAAAAFE